MSLEFSPKISLRLFLAIILYLGTFFGGISVFLVFECDRIVNGRNALEKSVHLAALRLAESLETDLRLINLDLKLAALNPLLSEDKKPNTIQFFLRNWQKIKTEYSDILYADRLGHVIATASNQHVGSNVSASSWFATSLTQMTLGDATEHIKAGVETASNMIAAGPVISPMNASAIGVLAVQLKPDWAAAIVKRLNVEMDQKLKFTLMNANGQIFYTSFNQREDEKEEYVEDAIPIGDPDDSGIGWLLIARGPVTVVSSPWTLLSITVMTVLSAMSACFGWFIGTLLTRHILPLLRTHSDQPIVKSFVTEFAELADHFVKHREGVHFYLNCIENFRALLFRSRQQLNAFEIMTGWNCWTVNLARAEVIWTDLSAGPDSSPTEKAMPLEDLLARIDEVDRKTFMNGLKDAENSKQLQEFFLYTLDDDFETPRSLLAIRVIESSENVLGELFHIFSCDLGHGRTTTADKIETLSTIKLAQSHQQIKLLQEVADGIARDIDDTLTIIKIAAENTIMGADHRQQVETVLRAIRRAGTLTRIQTSLSRKQIQHNGIIVDVLQTMDDVLEHLKQIVKSNHSIIVTTEIDLPAIACSERQFEFCLLSLILETKKLIQDDDATITISIGRHEAMPGFCHVAFDAPVNFKNSSELLNSINVLLMELGGSVDVKTVQADSIISLFFPVSVQPKKSGDFTKNHQCLRILLVDDDSLLRSVIARALEFLGHVVIETNSGADAAALLGQHIEYDAMLASKKSVRLNSLNLVESSRTARPTARIILFGPTNDFSPDENAFDPLYQPFGLTELKGKFGWTNTNVV